MRAFFSKFRRKKKNFNRKVLRKNDISILILDERWNQMFKNIGKPPEIEKLEQALKEKLKEQARLTAESKGIGPAKKKCMERILQLTTEAFENNNEEARRQMTDCEKEIKALNKRAVEVEKELDEVADAIKDVNLELLEKAVKTVYFRIRSDQKRVQELDKLIEETKNKLEKYTKERDTLSEDYSYIYSYFHDLLGGEELERLDRAYFK